PVPRFARPLPSGILGGAGAGAGGRGAAVMRAVLATGWCLVLGGLAAAGEPSAEFFEARVRPVLAEHCFRCHGPTKQTSGLPRRRSATPPGHAPPSTASSWRSWKRRT